MTHTIELPIRNVSCEACEKVIGRILRKFSHAKIESVSADAQTLTFTCEEKDTDTIKAKLREYNYLDEEKDSRPHFSYIAHQVIANTPGFEAEHQLLTHTLGLAGLLFLTLGLSYMAWFSQNELFIKIWPVLALVPLGIALNAGSLIHVRHLRHHFNCTNGMMAGMTIGMMSGFMSGAILGATNGMFVGSIIGMAIGMSASAYAVRKAGIMGILEGLMAGLMAGTMGAMLSVMMLSDNLMAFLYLLFGACTLILGGMSYFIVKEIGPIQDERKNVGFIPLAIISVLVLLIFLALIVWGPKSSLAWGSL
jgi:hypothetical protein